MNSEKIKIILIEDNPGDVCLIRQMLDENKSLQIELKDVDRLDRGLELMSQQFYDIVLLDLSLPDSQGLDTYRVMQERAPEVPVVVLTGLDDEMMAIEAVRAGAQDYLVKEQVDGTVLFRSVLYSIERNRFRQAVCGLSFIDELTGLYNRRGFIVLAKQQVSLACRKNNGFLLLFADLDGMKHINDTFGHLEGDQALKQTAEALRESFRETDIIARIGGDEFAVIAIDAAEKDTEIITGRLQKCLEKQNSVDGRRYKLSLSMGMTYCDRSCNCSIDELMEKADRLMYEQKRGKKKWVSEIMNGAENLGTS